MTCKKCVTIEERLGKVEVLAAHTKGLLTGQAQIEQRLDSLASVVMASDAMAHAMAQPSRQPLPEFEDLSPVEYDDMTDAQKRIVDACDDFIAGEPLPPGLTGDSLREYVRKKVAEAAPPVRDDADISRRERAGDRFDAIEARILDLENRVDDLKIEHLEAKCSRLSEEFETLMASIPDEPPAPRSSPSLTVEDVIAKRAHVLSWPPNGAAQQTSWVVLLQDVLAAIRDGADDPKALATAARGEDD